MLTLWEILEQLCNGGFLVESFRPDAASRVGIGGVMAIARSLPAWVMRCFLA